MKECIEFKRLGKEQTWCNNYKDGFCIAENMPVISISIKENIEENEA